MNLEPGQDYIITEKLTLTVASSDFNAIGGFHTLCADVGDIQDHPLRGYIAGDPLPTSLWNLNHRAKCGNNAGMVYDQTRDLWIDIYLFSSPDRKIRHEPFFDYVTLAQEQGKRLPTHGEFSSLAEGSNELTNIRGSKYDVNTGGHVDTLERRMISDIGCEDCAGLVYQWLSSVDPADSKYQLLAGGLWTDAASAGSRCRFADSSRWSTATNAGARFVSEPLHPRNRRTAPTKRKR
jgi:hypothetical protein